MPENLFATIQFYLIRIIVLLVSLSFHEMAHAWMALRRGDDTAYYQGRLTMNPLVHIDPLGAVAFLIGGIGWAKPVPINPVRFRGSMKSGIVLTSVAGPVSNILLALVSYLLGWIAFLLVPVASPIGNLLQTFFSVFFLSNLALAVFNMLPVPPLDGYKVIGAVLPNRLYYGIMAYERYIGMAFLLLVLFGRGVIGQVMSVLYYPFYWLITTPVDFVFRWIQQLVG